MRNKTAESYHGITMPTRRDPVRRRSSGFDVGMWRVMRKVLLIAFALVFAVVWLLHIGSETEAQRTQIQSAIHDSVDAVVTSEMDV